MGKRTTADREHARLLRFQQCPGCGFDFALGEGARSCHYYLCPYVPEALNTVCSTCNHNFFTGEGEPGCGDPPTCDFARDEAPQRVAALHWWLDQQAPERVPAALP